LGNTDDPNRRFVGRGIARSAHCVVHDASGTIANPELEQTQALLV
jgi:hypothetical protein